MSKVVEIGVDAEAEVKAKSRKVHEQMVLARENWQHRLHNHLAQYKQYPSLARCRDQQGSPKVAFTMSKSGEVLDVWLEQSSKIESLDRAALQLIYRAEPLPALPAEIEEQQVTLIVPINYSF